MLNSEIRKKLKKTALYLGVLLIVIWTLVPLVWLLISSISPHRGLLDISPWLPANPTLKHYKGFFNWVLRLEGGFCPHSEIA